MGGFERQDYRAEWLSSRREEGWFVQLERASISLTWATWTEEQNRPWGWGDN